MRQSERLDAVRFDELPKNVGRKSGRGLPQSKTDRLPPHSAEAEAGVLGCALLSAAEVLNECEERGVQPEWFYDVRFQLGYRAMAAMHQEGKAVDTITLMQWLKDRGELEQVGGLGELSQWSDAVPSAANLTYYLDIVEEKWLLRSAVRTGTEMVASAYSVEAGEMTTAREVIARAEQEILRLGEEGQRTNELAIKDILAEVINELEDYHRGHAQIRGISCGLEYVDKLLGGIGGKNGFQWILAARPGVGKTSFALQWLEYAALEYVWFDPVLQKNDAGKLVPIIDRDEAGEEKIRVERKVGVPVAMFSLEMDRVALGTRMAFSRARADLQRWRTGYATKADLAPLAVAVGQLAKGKIFIDDTGRCTIETLRAKARRMHRQHGIKLFVVDYLQLLRSGGKRFREDRVQELAEISGEIFALGKELKVPFLVLAQMNRDAEKDPNRAPRLSDLKDCGAIEQDADMVGFLHEPKMSKTKQEAWDAARERVYGEDWSKAPLRVNLLVAKYRHGPSGKSAELLFEGSSTRFLDYVRWMKEQGLKAPAAGERKQEALISDEDCER